MAGGPIFIVTRKLFGCNRGCAFVAHLLNINIKAAHHKMYKYLTIWIYQDDSKKKTASHRGSKIETCNVMSRDLATTRNKMQSKGANPQRVSTEVIIEIKQLNPGRMASHASIESI